MSKARSSALRLDEESDTFQIRLESRAKENVGLGITLINVDNQLVADTVNTIGLIRPVNTIRPTTIISSTCCVHVLPSC